jgi:DNA-binding transcriptional ArsR family regulator
MLHLVEHSPYLRYKNKTELETIARIMSNQSSPRSHQHNTIKASSEIFRALAHPLRMRICAVIDDKNPACVHEIYNALGIEQSLASQHLRILRQAKLVHTRREGKLVYYLLDYGKLACVGRTAGLIAQYIE